MCQAPWRFFFFFPLKLFPDFDIWKVLTQFFFLFSPSSSRSKVTPDVAGRVDLL